MFTGIVEELGQVKALSLRGNSGTLTVKAKKVLEGTKIGDSIAVNGVCLTVTNMKNNEFSADVMAETVRRSSLGALRDGSYVNLERAMAEYLTKMGWSGPWRRMAGSAVISFPVILTEPVKSNR